MDSFEVAGLAAADLCGVLGAPPAGDAGVRSTACDGLRQAARAARDRYRTTAFASPGAFSFGWVQDNGGSGAMAALAAKAGLLRGGRAVGAGARDYLLGRNPWGQRLRGRPLAAGGGRAPPLRLPEGQPAQAAQRRGGGRPRQRPVAARSRA